MESHTPQWDEIVEEHSAQVYRLAYRLTGNRQDAEDLMQDVFVRVFNSLDSYEPGNFAGWVHRITTNLFLDKARKAQRHKTHPLFDGAEERMPSADVLPEYVVHDAGFDPDIEAALAALPREFRVAVVLCDVEGLSYEEISDVLGVKLGTVRSRIHRGRAQLRAALSHREPPRGRTRFLGSVGV
ncbi:RNA polymerase sigma factor SigE [uncultured Aeromicrobium sp.]|uniref:RNA polymerase sigma factor SigE n=1 Tax=uncultured Aeromicrobium sp. TaxID=337820 RepID=UPI0025FA33C7|nr:RNA polymerase sigma factor SigE [uncultured Aeromicrobium sp.]